MDSPVGNTVGHALEVAEAVDCLHGNGPRPLVALIATLGEFPRSFKSDVIGDFKHKKPFGARTHRHKHTHTHTNEYYTGTTKVVRKSPG